jgi:hypothetical protein
MLEPIRQALIKSTRRSKLLEELNPYCAIESMDLVVQPMRMSPPCYTLSTSEDSVVAATTTGVTSETRKVKMAGINCREVTRWDQLALDSSQTASVAPVSEKAAGTSVHPMGSRTTISKLFFVARQTVARTRTCVFVNPDVQTLPTTIAMKLILSNRMAKMAEAKP